MKEKAAELTGDIGKTYTPCHAAPCYVPIVVFVSKEAYNATYVVEGKQRWFMHMSPYTGFTSA